MKTLFRWTFRLFLLTVLIISGFLIHVIYFKPAKIDWFYTRVFAEYALEDPELLSSLRILPSWLDFYSDDLADASLVHQEKQAEKLKEDLATLRRYDRSSMSREGQLSYVVLESFLADQLEGDKFRYHDFPLNQMSGIQSGLPNFMADVHQVNNEKDAKNYILRLEKFTIKFDQILEGLRLRETRNLIPPKFTVEKVIKQMNDFSSKSAKENPLYVTFKEKIDKISAEKMAASTRESLLNNVETAIQNHVYPAYRKLIDHFTTLLPKAQGNFGAWHLPDGDAYYAWAVKHHTTTNLTPEQIHLVGLNEVARIKVEMEEILRTEGLIEGTVGDRIRQLSQDPEQLYPNTPEGKQAQLNDYQTIIDEIDQNIASSFNARAKLGVKVKAVPEFSQATAPGAYYEPGSFDGSRPGIFYANMRNTEESPKFTMRTLAYHEAIPGHHFQIAIAQELEGVPFFRRILGFTAYVEGWALYAERLAWELGFQKKPLDNLGRLRDEMMRAVRLVVDTGIHSKKWTREQAIEYMMENTGMAETDVVAEIERYFVNPGQALAYKIGMLKILELREKAKQELGNKFDLKQFHDEVLTHGALPLTLLEQVINQHIEEVKVLHSSAHKFK